MLNNSISFGATSENSVLNGINNARDKIVYTQEVNPDDTKMEKFNKGVHNAISVEKYDDKEGADLAKAQFHNLAVSIVNPLAVVPATAENIKMANRKLQEEKAKAAYQQY